MKPNSQQPIICHTNDLSAIQTAHSSGTKKILMGGDATGNAITQIAFGELQAGEVVEIHQHATMKEYFYFISGEGVYNINEVEHILSAGTFVMIPEQTPHSLKNTGELPLQFFYFGLATE